MYKAANKTAGKFSASLEFIDVSKINIHPDALQAYTAWCDIPRQQSVPAAATSGRCLVLQTGADLRLVAGFDALDAALRYRLALLAIVTRSLVLDASAIRTIAWCHVAELPRVQIDLQAGAALWLEIVNTKMPTDLRLQWFGKPAIPQSAAANIFGVTRERVAPSRLEGKP